MSPVPAIACMASPLNMYELQEHVHHHPSVLAISSRESSFTKTILCAVVVAGCEHHGLLQRVQFEDTR